MPGDVIQIMSYQVSFRKVLLSLGVFDLARMTWQKRGKLALMFHGIASRYYPEFFRELQPTLTANALDEILAWLKDYFIFLTPQEFLFSDSPGVLLTFDDGLASNYVNALPLLEKHNAPGIFFVSTQHVLEPMNWLPSYHQMAIKGWGSAGAVPFDVAQDFYMGLSPHQLAACAVHPLITIGSHTRGHPFLTRCSSVELISEIVDSKKVLEQITGKSVDYFAYPTGDYNAEVAAVVKRGGYRAAFAVDAASLTELCYEIPRIGIYSSDKGYLRMKLSGLYRRPLFGKLLSKE